MLPDMMARTRLLLEGEPARSPHQEFLSRRQMSPEQARAFRKTLPALRERAVEKFVSRLSVKQTPKTFAPYQPPYRRNSGRLPMGTYFPHGLVFDKRRHAVPMARTLRFMNRVAHAAGGEVHEPAAKIGYFRASFADPRHSKLALKRIAGEFDNQLNVQHYGPEDPSDTDQRHHIEIPHDEIHKTVVDHLNNTKLFEWRRTPLLVFAGYRSVV